MFGYVTVCREAMSEEDYDLFRAYYCGVCKATGKRASQLARLGLSYDITFLALVIAAVFDSENTIKSEKCIAHPMKKRNIIRDNDAVDYAADMGVILTYLKLRDDVHDDKSIKALFLSMLFYKGVRKIRKKYVREYDEIINQLENLSRLEKENCKDIDMCADCFAKILETLFTPDFIKDTDTRRILAWLGYNTGRWIYVIDAYNDMDKDRKKKNYNPFLACEYKDFDEHKQKIRERLCETLTFTLENVASSFELLKIYKNRSVIEHIIYQGLMAKQSVILGEKNESV